MGEFGEAMNDLKAFRKEEKEAIQDRRTANTIIALHNRGLMITKHTNKCVQFMYKGKTVTVWPFSGWHTGKTIKDGRGLKNLLKQLDGGDK